MTTKRGTGLALGALLWGTAGCWPHAEDDRLPPPSPPPAPSPDLPDTGPIDPPEPDAGTPAPMPPNRRSPPPPIGAATVRLLADGHTVVASDPDRDLIWVVDLE